MDEDKVPPDLFSLADDEEGKADHFVLNGSVRLGARGGDVDLAANVPEEDEAVSAIASRFRQNQMSDLEISNQSLDELDDEDEDEDEDLSEMDLQDFILGALEGDEEEDEEELLEVELESLDTEESDLRHTERVVEPPVQPAAPPPKPAADPHQVTCPHCAASNNPPGMKFCVQCGGSLSISKTGATTQKRQIPPPSDLSRKENPWKISLISINEDGSDGVNIPLQFLETTIGRDGDTRFPTDAFLSPKHARLHIEKGELYLEDLYSLNGTFLKLRDEARLTPGDTFLMGRQVLRFERFEQAITPKTKSSDGTRYMGSPSPGGSFKILQIGIGGVVQNVYCLPESGAVLGREKGDIIFPHDKFMSSRHAQIYVGDDGHCYLVDLNSSNGTWIKIWERTKLHDTDFIFMAAVGNRSRIHPRRGGC